jgi:ribosomal protein S18 acetylase RimI-like enzyme
VTVEEVARPSRRQGYMPEATIRRATDSDLDLLAPLFDSYRQFYHQASNLALARTFLEKRIEREESIVLLALAERNAPLGFVQLYPTFSSISAAPILILNDLFVVPEARRSGVGRLLLRAAAETGRAAGAVRLTLSTEVSNRNARALYEAEGWALQTGFAEYSLALS